jgi:energy-coupling factor transporter ATP-binding protein EcfA2
MGIRGFELLKAIGQWNPLAEKDEHIVELFYSRAEFGDLERRRCALLIGEKGSGKTAIAKYFAALDPNIPATRLVIEFREVRKYARDFSARLADPKDAGLRELCFRAALLYASLDAFFGSSIDSNDPAAEEYKKARMRAQGRSRLQRILGIFQVRRLETKSGDFSASVEFGRGAKKRDRDIVGEAERIALDFWSGKIGLNPFIFIDGLDEVNEIYRPEEQADAMLDVSSIIKACMHWTGAGEKFFHYVLLLRPDLIRPDTLEYKSKAHLGNLRLVWDEFSLRQLAIERVSKTAKSAPGESEETFLSLFANREAGERFWSLMLRFSFYRPRDVVSMLSIAAKSASEKGMVHIPVEAKFLEGVVAIHKSLYFKEQALEELKPHIVGAEKIIVGMGNFGRKPLEIKTVKSWLEKNYPDSGNPDFVIRALFTANVIGNTTAAGDGDYRYKGEFPEIDPSRTVKVHFGLVHKTVIDDD